MTEAKRLQIEQVIRSLIEEGVRPAAELFRQVEEQIRAEQEMQVDLPALQRVFYHMLSNGTVRLDSEFAPVLVD